MARAIVQATASVSGYQRGGEYNVALTPATKALIDKRKLRVVAYLNDQNEVVDAPAADTPAPAAAAPATVPEPTPEPEAEEKPKPRRRRAAASKDTDDSDSSDSDEPGDESTSSDDEDATDGES